jgi:hypothetical protein
MQNLGNPKTPPHTPILENQSLLSPRWGTPSSVSQLPNTYLLLYVLNKLRFSALLMEVPSSSDKASGQYELGLMVSTRQHPKKEGGVSNMNEVIQEGSQAR